MAKSVAAVCIAHTWETSVEDARGDRARRRGREDKDAPQAKLPPSPPHTLTLPCDLFTSERLIHHVKVVAGGVVSDFKLGVPAPTSKVVSATEPRCFDS